MGMGNHFFLLLPCYHWHQTANFHHASVIRVISPSWGIPGSPLLLPHERTEKAAYTCMRTQKANAWIDRDTNRHACTQSQRGRGSFPTASQKSGNCSWNLTWNVWEDGVSFFCRQSAFLRPVIVLGEGLPRTSSSIPFPIIGNVYWESAHLNTIKLVSPISGEGWHVIKGMLWETQSC